MEIKQTVIADGGDTYKVTEQYLKEKMDRYVEDFSKFVDGKFMDNTHKFVLSGDTYEECYNDLVDMLVADARMENIREAVSA